MPLFAALFLLSACDPEPTSALADSAVPLPGPIHRVLTVSMPDPIVLGQPLEVTVSGAPPGQVVHLYGTFDGPGQGTLCPRWLGYACVEIVHPVRLGRKIADANGEIHLTGVPLPERPTGTLWVQAVGAGGPRFDPTASEVQTTTVVRPCADDDEALSAEARVLFEVSGPAAPGAPVTVDVDLGAALAAAGLPRDPGRVRVVRQSCELGFPEIPAQFVDTLRALDRKEDHHSAPGDGDGLVALMFDEDGDAQTPEVLAAGEVALYGIYVDSAPDVPRISDLQVVGMTMSNALTQVTFDPARGGLISAIGPLGAPSLTSQTGSCCGNSMHFWAADVSRGITFGWWTPQGTTGAVTVEANGPILAAVRSTGARDAVEPVTGQRYGAYTWDQLAWMFTGRPEVWLDVHHVATADSTTEHPQQAWLGFRPIQLRHTTQLSTSPSYTNDPDGRWGRITGNGRVSLGLAVVRPPAEGAEIANPLTPTYLGVYGNELVGPGLPAPYTVPAGVAFFDHVGLALVPETGSGSNATLDALFELPTATVLE